MDDPKRSRRLSILKALKPSLFGGTMEIFNKSNAKNTGQLPILSSWMLISPRNSSTQGLSVQISEVPVGSEQPAHNHDPEQCYYIIKGKGLMIIEEETREVTAGDAVYIPSNSKHGIQNIGNDVLEYLTANSPPFSEDNENALWPADSVRDQ
jgi:mannose-6-phosphate isomerase-like protein (cupin superfamily)